MMNKRGFFVFTPIVVLVFISALVTINISLDDVTEVIEQPLAQHAQNIIETRIAFENKVSIPREMEARYAVSDAVYELAAGAGYFSPNLVGCKFIGNAVDPVKQNIIAIPSTGEIMSNFQSHIKHRFEERKVEADYEITVEDRIIIRGVPDISEGLSIPGMDEGVRTPGEYRERVSWTVQYDYPMVEIYDQMRMGLDEIMDCRFEPSAGLVKSCVELAINSANSKDIGGEPILSWEYSNTGNVYDVSITQFTDFFLCNNQPKTIVTINMEPVPSPTII